MEKRPVAGTLIRGADGKLYFIPDAILAPYQITEHQADMIGPVIGDAPSLRLPLDPAVRDAHGLSIESEVHGIGESETHGVVGETHGHTPDENDQEEDDEDTEDGDGDEEDKTEEEEDRDTDEEEDTGMGDVHGKPVS